VARSEQQRQPTRRNTGLGWRLLTMELESHRTFSPESSIHLSKAAALAPAVWDWG
jgi:hypothetical protein